MQVVWFAQADSGGSRAPVPLVGAFIAALIALAFGRATFALGGSTPLIPGQIVCPGRGSNPHLLAERGV